MDSDVDAALAQMEVQEAGAVAPSRAVRAHPASPYRQLWIADRKRAVAAWVAQGELILVAIE